MGDLKDKKLIYLKGWLFLLLGLGAAFLLFMDMPSIKTAILLILAIWGFCRFYYFAFYVIEHYVDGNYKFAGLIDFIKYLTKKNEE